MHNAQLLYQIQSKHNKRRLCHIIREQQLSGYLRLLLCIGMLMAFENGRTPHRSREICRCNQKPVLLKLSKYFELLVYRR